MGRFSRKMRVKTAYKNHKTWYYTGKDRDSHGSRKWKLKDKSGERTASLSGDGKILAK